MRELHRLGIHHGDLRPSNMAVAAPHGEPVRLFDFSESCPATEDCWESYCSEISLFEFACRVNGTGTDLDELLAQCDGSEPKDQSVTHETPPF